MQQDIDESLDRLFIGNAQMPAAMHQPFNDEICMEIKVNNRHYQRWIVSAPARLLLHRRHGWSHQTPELFRHIVECGQEMAVSELDYVDVHQQPVLGVVVDYGPHGSREQE